MVHETAACASACVFILAGGVERHVSSLAHVGVHRMSKTYVHRKMLRRYQVTWRLVNGRKVEIARKLVSEQIVNTGTSKGEGTKGDYSRIRRFFADMGMANDLMALLEATPNEKIHWLTLRELSSTNMATGAWPGRLVAQEAALAARPPGTQVAAAVESPAPAPAIVRAPAPANPWDPAVITISMGQMNGAYVAATVTLAFRPGSGEVSVAVMPRTVEGLLPTKSLTAYLIWPSGQTMVAANSDPRDPEWRLSGTMPVASLCRLDRTEKLDLRLVTKDADGEVVATRAHIAPQEFAGVNAKIPNACADTLPVVAGGPAFA